MNNLKDVLEQELDELQALGLAMQMNGLADPRNENPISALVDAIEDPSRGHSIAHVVALSVRDAMVTVNFANAVAVMDFLIEQDQFVTKLQQIGVVTKKNKAHVQAALHAVLAEVIQRYAEQYHRQEKQKWLENAKPVRYDSEGRLR